MDYAGRVKQCVEESIHVRFDEESYTDEKVTHSPSIFQELLSCPFDEAPSAEDKTDSSDPIIPVPCSLNQDIAATSADNSLSADETLEAEDSPETDNVPVSISPESTLVIEHRDHPVDRIIGNIHDESIHVRFDEESYTDEKVTHSPSIFQELLSCPFDEAPSAEDKTDSSDPIIPVPCSLNQDIAATSADNSLSADETLEAEDSPETDNVSVSISPESTSVIEHRDHPVDRIIGNIHDGVRTRSSALNNFCIILKYSPMAASLFTYSSTSRRVVPAPNSPPLPIHIKETNVVFNPDIPEVHRGLGLDDFVNFLASCRLRYAISDVLSEFFPEQVCEFYYTTTVNEENNAITGTIGHGRHSVFITAELLSAALRLPIFEPFSEPPTIEICKRIFDQLGYDHSKAGTRSALILRQCMTPGWKFFTGALCKCVGHKSRIGDQLSNYEQQVVC
ncbi:unnamed protein product [Lactuca saligna]|uniref:Uncharacterized protein n=1 Tax=Lactuca saligna TaxID=75948 RepID=A0AA35YYF8_LACSI|nr:unnamed protein product [Lactuca saligna]